MDIDDSVSARDARAVASLAGLSTADAYGNQFFDPRLWAPQRFPGGLRTTPAYPPGHTAEFVAAAHEPRGPWPWTDDSEMACGVVAELRRHHRIDADSLATTWAAHFQLPRDYGGSALDILYGVRDGGDWRGLSGRAFDGAGSRGNGAAMRIAPLGAWFADNLPLVVEQAELASRVTHMHVDGVAGGIAVAVAAALAARPDTPAPDEFLATVIGLTPDSAVQDGIRTVRALGPSVNAGQVAETTGNGAQISAADTVPLAIWCAAWHLDDYPLAVRSVVSAGGDMDTTAAITGGIVAAGHPEVGIPVSWLDAREPLPDWLSPSR